MKRRKIEGTVRHIYSSGEGCMCCPGRHRFASHIENTSDSVIPGSGGGWIHDMIRGVPDGTRVRITIEEVRMVEPCPECKAGKHQNCDGTAWDTEKDAAVPCPCVVHEQNTGTVLGVAYPENSS